MQACMHSLIHDSADPGTTRDKREEMRGKNTKIVPLIAIISIWLNHRSRLLLHFSFLWLSSSARIIRIRTNPASLTHCFRVCKHSRLLSLLDDYPDYSEMTMIMWPNNVTRISWDDDDDTARLGADAPPDLDEEDDHRRKTAITEGKRQY